MVKDVRTIEDMRIQDFRHRITLCSMEDVVVDGSEMRLTRKGIYSAWAYIAPKRGSMFGKSGYVIQEKRDSQSHNIIIRYRPDIEFSSAAWIHDQRLKSAPRWFKILGYQNKDEASEYFIFSVRLVEQGDFASPPVEEKSNPHAMPLPNGVRL